MIMALETALSAPATQPAKAIEDVFVSDKPVSPKKALLLALGLIGGLLAGVVCGVLRRCLAAGAHSAVEFDVCVKSCQLHVEIQALQGDGTPGRDGMQDP